MACAELFEGDLVFRTNPFAARLLSRLVTQLVPAAVVTGVGILMLSNLAKGPDTTPPAPSVETAINAEAVFTATPREPEAPAASAVPAAVTKSAAPRIVAAPKQVAGSTVNTALPPRRPANDQQVASAPAPLPTVQIPAPPQVAATAPVEDNSMMGKLRSATATVQSIPQRTARSVAGWFAADTPPRPPASVPQNFQASM
jgi:hypothetical protein